MKKKLKTKFICIGCKFSTTQWLGRCPECQEWNSLEEENIFVSSNYNDPSISLEYPRKVTEINKINYSRITTGISEFDRVLGGGIVSGSLILVGGEPGIGKSTLLTDVLGKLAINYKSDKILYISGEESSAQVASRSRRLGIDCGNYLIYHQTNWQKILAQLAKLKPKFIVIDSI
jgi:DNA repair protein RadA/Sms